MQNLSRFNTFLIRTDEGVADVLIDLCTTLFDIIRCDCYVYAYCMFNCKPLTSFSFDPILLMYFISGFCLY